MAIRSRHGRAKSFGVGSVVEVLPFDELPKGTLAIELAEAGDERRPDGRLLPGSSTAQRKGGFALKMSTSLGSKFDLGGVVAAAEFQPYKTKARAFAKAHRNHLARTVGGGQLGPGPSSMIMAAALELAAGRYLYDTAAATGDAKLFGMAARLLDCSRQNLAAAHEYAAKEAASLPRENDIDRLKRELALESPKEPNE